MIVTATQVCRIAKPLENVYSIGLYLFIFVMSNFLEEAVVSSIQKSSIH
jgi:hypothetical protein